MFTLIVAMDEERNIGKNGWMPWHLPEDLKQFKARTLNHTIVMGKTTFAAIGKPLPKRRNLVVTHDLSIEEKYPGVEGVFDFQEYLKRNWNTPEEIFICGGSRIYTQALPYCHRLVISLVDGVFEADTKFPAYDESAFEVESIEKHEGFTVKTLRRKVSDA